MQLFVSESLRLPIELAAGANLVEEPSELRRFSNVTLGSIH